MRFSPGNFRSFIASLYLFLLHHYILYGQWIKRVRRGPEMQKSDKETKLNICETKPDLTKLCVFGQNFIQDCSIHPPYP